MTNPYEKSLIHLDAFCRKITERCVGSAGNRQATEYFERQLSKLGWQTRRAGFEAVDWVENGVALRSEASVFHALVSPYSLAFSGEAELAAIGSVGELENSDITNKIVLLHGEIAKEQLMPKNFVFYNPGEHKRIISLLEIKRPGALICATSRDPEAAGGVYPFPLFEDGDFDIPSVYMTEEEGRKLFPSIGKKIFLESASTRIPSEAYNVIAVKGRNDARKIVITAHIDAKKGTPGAIDNATGVIVLLLLADLLQDYSGDKLLEIVALNGEDYYSAPGQMNYLMENRDHFDRILLNINVDGVGYKEGLTALSLFDLPADLHSAIHEVMKQFPGLTEGIQWYQGDHSMFLQNGLPAIAVSSKWLFDHIMEQDITHTPKDDIDIVDCNKLVEVSEALNRFIRKI